MPWDFVAILGDGDAVETCDSDDSAMSTSGTKSVEKWPGPEVTVGAVAEIGIVAIVVTAFGVGRQLIHWHRLTWVVLGGVGKGVRPKNGSADEGVGDLASSDWIAEQHYDGSVALRNDGGCCNGSQREWYGGPVEEAE